MTEHHISGLKSVSINGQNLRCSDFEFHTDGNDVPLPGYAGCVDLTIPMVELTLTKEATRFFQRHANRAHREARALSRASHQVAARRTRGGTLDLRFGRVSKAQAGLLQRLRAKGWPAHLERRHDGHVIVIPSPDAVERWCGL